MHSYNAPLPNIGISREKKVKRNNIFDRFVDMCKES